MNLNLVLRITYGFAWAFFVIAIIYRILLAFKVLEWDKMPFEAHTVLLFSGFLFVVTVATAAYIQAQTPKSRGTGA